MNKIENSAEVKPGYMTTEFWIQIVFAGLGLLMFSGKITPSESNELANVATSIGSLVPTIAYIISRWKIKNGNNNNVDMQSVLTMLSNVSQAQMQMHSQQQQQYNNMSGSTGTPNNM